MTNFPFVVDTFGKDRASTFGRYSLESNLSENQEAVLAGQKINRRALAEIRQLAVWSSMSQPNLTISESRRDNRKLYPSATSQITQNASKSNIAATLVGRPYSAAGVHPFQSVARFECLIESVDQNGFIAHAERVDVRDGSFVKFEFSRDDVPSSDAKYIKEGAKFYYLLGYETGVFRKKTAVLAFAGQKALSEQRVSEIDDAFENLFSDGGMEHQ